MKGILHIAWHYLSHHWVKTAILVTSVTLIFFIPAGLQVLVAQSERQMTARAEATPLLVGAKGSPLELVLNSLYFEGGIPERIKYGESTRVRDTGFAHPIPLYVRFRAQTNPIIGTSLDYFDFRGLHVVRGRPMSRLGECVLGAEVARSRDLGPGDVVISSPDSFLNIAGVYPLEMRVTGVLARTNTPDDQAIFVDVKTAWIIEGLCHGHEDLTRPEAASRVLKREPGRVVGNASVKQYRAISADNLDSFHFHGDRATFPITAVIALPKSEKAATLLMGRYEVPDERHQILEPVTVLDDLLETVVAVKDYVVTALVLVGIATLATAALVFLLSLRLRRREIETMVKIGGSRLHVGAVLASEIVLVLVAGAVLATLLTWFTSWYGSGAIRALLRH